MTLCEGTEGLCVTPHASIGIGSKQDIKKVAQVMIVGEGEAAPCLLVFGALQVCTATGTGIQHHPRASSRSDDGSS
jgi:hypothetical protein